METDAFTVIVPARLTSTRLPNKPLADIGGTPMLVRVLQQAAASGAAQVIAAVEESELAEVAERAGYRAVLTGTHTSGSSRSAAAAAELQLPPEAIVVNVQGDEPFIEPEIIRACAERAAASTCACATPCRPLQTISEYTDPAAVKVVRNKDDSAAYFSRAPIPYQRTADASPPHPPDDNFILQHARVHIGLYAYRLGELIRYLALPPAPSEQAEQLEQLRILWHGGRIQLVDCTSASFGIDTEEDLARARQRASAAQP